MSEIEPLPPALRALFDDERAAYPEDAQARARVLRRIETAVAFTPTLGPSGGGPAAPTNGGAAVKAASAAAKKTAAWVALAFAGGLAAGELHGRSTTSPAPPSPAPSASPASIDNGGSVSKPPPQALSAGPATPDDAPTTKPSAVPMASAASPSKATPSADPASDLAAEQALIDTARAALSRGRGGDALRAADEHASRFPRGRLSQERELLGIQALLLSGRRGDAEARGQRFKTAFPRSLYGSAIDELLGTAPKDAGR